MAALLDERGEEDATPSRQDRVLAFTLRQLRGHSGVIRDVRCPFCMGNVCNQYGEITCMMCSRTLHIGSVAANGRILSLSTMRVIPRTSRVGCAEQQRSRRGMSRHEGRVGLAARVLAIVPKTDEYITATAVASQLSIGKPEARDILEDLVADNLLVSFTYRGGYRTGYRRPKEV